MVHIVEKKTTIGAKDHIYLYLQKSIYDHGKRRTEHVAYLGKKDKYTPEQLGHIINAGNKASKKHLNSLLKKYNKTTQANR